MSSLTFIYVIVAMLIGGVLGLYFGMMNFVLPYVYSAPNEAHYLRKATPIYYDPSPVWETYVLSVPQRTFRSRPWMNVHYVSGNASDVTGDIYNEGYGEQAWPLGARLVAEGHVTVWRRIAEECEWWCLVSEDDALWPAHGPIGIPEGARIVSFYPDGVYLNAREFVMPSFDKIMQSVTNQGIVYGAVAYALNASSARYLLSHLPMKVPVDHFLWHMTRGKGAYVSTKYAVKHGKGPSVRLNKRL